MYTDRTVKNTMMLNVKKASHGLTISWYGSYASSKVVAPNQPHMLQLLLRHLSHEGAIILQPLSKADHPSPVKN